MTNLANSEPQQKHIDDLLPFLRAWKLSTCQLYWIPVSTTPVPFRQRQWLLEFITRFDGIAKKYEVIPQTFLQMKVIQPNLRDDFIKSGRQLVPIIGLSRRPGQPMPPVPDKAYADDLAKGRIEYDPQSLQPDFSYWFTGGEQAEILPKFFGHGGITTLYMSSDENTKPPEIKIPPRAYKNPQIANLLKTNSLDHINKVAYSLKSKFLKESKLAFGKDLVDEPQYPGLLFTLPLLGSTDFFDATPEDVDTWFSLFDFYLQESPRDKGLILATKHDIEEDLITLLHQMRDEKIIYPS